MEPGYNLGAIWLQVIPSFDNVQRRAREEGRKAGQEFWAGFESANDPAKDRKARDDARKRGEEIAKAEAEGRSKAQTAAEKRSELARQKHDQDLLASEKKHQQKLAETQAKGAEDRATIQEKYLTDRIAAEDAYFQERQEAEDKFFRDTEKLEADHAQRRKTNAAKSAADRERDERKHRDELEAIREKHSNNLELLDRKREQDERQRRENLNDYIARLDEKAQRDVAKERRTARERGQREELAAERRHAVEMGKLRDVLVKRGITDPEGFKRKMDQQIDRALKNVDAKVDLELDTTEAGSRLRDFQMRLTALRDADVRVDVDAVEAISKFMSLIALAEQLERDKINIDFDIDAGKALAELTALQATTAAVDRQGRQLGSSYADAGANAGSAANAFRAMNGVLLATLVLGPLVVPVLMSLVGALAAVAAAALGAFAAIGVGALAMSGVGDALGAMSDLESEQRYGQTPATRRRTARQSRGRDRAVRDARRGVDSAQASAAAAVTAAVDRQARAEKALERAQVSARRAQEQLTRARREARREIEDMNDALISGTLSEQDALYDLEEARYALFRIMQDGSATQRERDRAQLSYDIQAQQYAQLQKQNDRLLVDTNEANRAGVEGSERVVGAKEQIAQANEAVVDAERDVADAAKAVTDAQRDGAEQVARAQERLQDALLDQREAALDAAEGVGALDTAQRKLREAMDNLGPAGAAFATFLFGLKPLLDELRFAAQEGFLPGLQAGLELVVDTYGPRLLDFVDRFSTAMGGYAELMGEWLVQPQVISFFDTLGEYALTFMDQFALISPALTEGLMGVMLALLPFAEDFGWWILQLSEAFATWANSEEGQAAMATFFDYLRNVTPETAQMLAAAVMAIANALISLAPYTDDLIEVVTSLFTWIAEMDTDQLGRLIIGVGALTVAFQLFAFTMGFVTTTLGFWKNVQWIGSGVSTVLSFFGIGKKGAAMNAAASAGALGKGKFAARALMRFGVIGMVIGAVIWGLFELYEHVEPFRNFVDGIVGAITTAWNEYLYPAFSAIWGWLKDILGPVFEGFGVLVGQVWEWIAFGAELSWTILELIFKVFYAAVLGLGAIFSWLYEKAIGPAWDWISEKISSVYNNHIKPVLDAFGNLIEEHVAPKFESGVRILGSIWDGLKKLFAAPIDIIVNSIINRGIIDTLNSVFEFFDIGTVDHVQLPPSVQSVIDSPWPWQFATGGILPGYTPGRDVYDFIDPASGQRLRLGGGEAIMRPEVTRALGPKTIDALNGAAMSGGVGGVRSAMRSLVPDGSPWDWVSNAGATVWNGVKSAASWVGDIATYAWDFATDPIGSLKAVVEDLVSDLIDFSQDSTIGRLAVGVPMGLIDNIGSSITSMLGMADASKHLSGPVPKTSGTGGIYGAQPHVNAAANRLAAMAGGIDLMQAFNRSMAGDHPQGLAVDFIDDISTLNRLALIAERNAEALGLRYMAWQGRLFTPGAGWRPQTSGYGNDPMHRWHAHVSFNPMRARAYADGGVTPTSWADGAAQAPTRLYDDGGWWKSGEFGLNLSGRPEAVFTGEEMDVFKQIASGRGGKGDTILDIDVNHPGATAGEIADEMLFAIRQSQRGGAYV